MRQPCRHRPSAGDNPAWPPARNPKMSLMLREGDDNDAMRRLLHIFWDVSPPRRLRSGRQPMSRAPEVSRPMIMDSLSAATGDPRKRCRRRRTQLLNTSPRLGSPLKRPGNARRSCTGRSTETRPADRIPDRREPESATVGDLAVLSSAAGCCSTLLHPPAIHQSHSGRGKASTPSLA